MTFADTFLAEFEQECETTRRFLERLPEDELMWKPHEKSMTAGQLGLHIAQVPGLVIQMATQGEMQMSEIETGVAQPESVQEIMDAFDASRAQVKEMLPSISDAEMGETWSLKNGDQDLLVLPKAAFIRSIMLNHWYHHRGQIGVYLRLLGCSVPSSYGPSGDEPPEFLKDVQLETAS